MNPPMSFIKITTTVFLVAALSGCQTEKENHVNIIDSKPVTSGPFTPKAPLAITPDGAKRLAGLKKIVALSELFPTERLIELESTDNSLLAEISDCILQGDQLLILDAVQSQIFEFDQYGNFKGLFGRKGQGPGEYQGPQYMKRGYGNNILVLDVLAGSIKVYDYSGNVIKESPRYIDGDAVFPRLAFSWAKTDRMFIGEVSTRSGNPGGHLVIDTSSDEMHRLAFFGERHPLKDMTKPSFSLAAFEEVGDMLWVGSPYESFLKVYDRDGNDLGHLGKTARFGMAITAQDWDDVDLQNKAEVFKMRMRKKSNHCIQPVGDYVLVHLMPNAFELYDRYGYLVRDNLAAKNLLDPLDSFDNRIVTIFPEFEDFTRYIPDDHAHMPDVNWSREKLEKSNPFLRISALIPELQ